MTLEEHGCFPLETTPLCIQDNRAEMQYQTQPTDQGGAVGGRKQSRSSNLKQTLLFAAIIENP